MKHRILFIFLIALLGGHEVSAQILHAESFSVILDTAKRMKGSIIPDFKFQTLKEDLIEFENLSDITFRFGKNALTFANKIELSKYGDEVLLSGGYLYIEYRRIQETKFTLEPYSQFHWSEARGMAYKYAGGVNMRYRAIKTEQMGVFAGMGPFYELERWTYEGVDDDLIPEDAPDITTKNIKWGSYASLLWISDYNITLNASVYHQSRLDELFSTPRLASSTGITYNFTEYLGLTFIYQNIYDFKPIVPIKKLFNRVIFTIDVSF